MEAKVVNIRREKCDVLITRETKWGNPYYLKNDTPRERTRVIRLYKEYLLSNMALMNALSELEGKKLGCVCSPKPCHGDVLIETLNARKEKDESQT